MASLIAACGGFFNQSDDLLRSIQAPKETLIHKIYEKRNKNDTCSIVIGNAMGNVMHRQLGKLFSLIPNLGAQTDFLLRLAHTLLRRNTFVDSHPVFQSQRSGVVRRDLPKEIKSFLSIW